MRRVEGLICTNTFKLWLEISKEERRVKPSFYVFMFSFHRNSKEINYFHAMLAS